MNIKNQYRLEPIGLKIGKFRIGWELQVTQSLKDYWGEKLVCQNCGCIIDFPMFFSESRIKLYCEKCVRDKKKFIDAPDFKESEKEMIRISKITIMEDEEL